MSAVSLPRDVRAHLRQEVWKRADALDWAHLSLAEKTKYYRLWAEDDEIGGLLSHYMDRGSIRHYLKESLLDDYTEKQQSDDAVTRRVLGIPSDMATRRTWTKPHGHCFVDGRVVCWGRANNWKSIIMALFERTYGIDGTRPYAAVLHKAEGQYSEAGIRSMVEAAASRLGIEVVRWL